MGEWRERLTRERGGDAWRSRPRMMSRGAGLRVMRERVRGRGAVHRAVPWRRSRPTCTSPMRRFRPTRSLSLKEKLIQGDPCLLPTFLFYWEEEEETSSLNYHGKHVRCTRDDLLMPNVGKLVYTSTYNEGRNSIMAACRVRGWSGNVGVAALPYKGLQFIKMLFSLIVFIQGMVGLTSCHRKFL